MASLSKNRIKRIVEIALHVVADFTGDIENYGFNGFNDLQKRIFLNKLNDLILSEPYHDDNDCIDYSLYYDVPLLMSYLNSWSSISDCINFIFENQAVDLRPNKKIQLS